MSPALKSSRAVSPAFNSPEREKNPTPCLNRMTSRTGRSAAWATAMDVAIAGMNLFNISLPSPPPAASAGFRVRTRFFIECMPPERRNFQELERIALPSTLYRQA